MLNTDADITIHTMQNKLHKKVYCYHGDQIAKPLMCEFMTHNKGDPLLGGGGRVGRVNEQGGLAVRH